MKLEEFMQKVDEKGISQMEQHQSMDELKKYLLQEGVIMSPEEEEWLHKSLLQKKKGTALSDDQLDSISGGGYYRPIHNCPNGHTKKVLWFFTSGQNGRGIMDDDCRECEHAKKELGRYGYEWVCLNFGDTKWEW